MSLYLDFLTKGLCVIPLRKGVPTIKTWIPYQFDLPDRETVAQWNGNEYGLICGEVSGITAIDIDTDEPDVIALIESIAGHSPVKKRGTKGYTSFFKFNGEKSTNWIRSGERQPLVSLLVEKRITTIPPSPHRHTGIPYVWIGESDDLTNLPTLKPDFITFMDAKFPKPHRKIKNYGQSLSEKIEFSDAEDMLDFISSDCSRDQWIDIGMALKDEYGDAACATWHRWSAKSGKRYNHNDAQSAWRSFTGQGVTIGTLKHFAMQGGWIRSTNRQEYVGNYDVDISYLFKKPKETEIIAHGLVGEIADWMTRTAWKPQPLLSLSAALTFVGFLKGRKFITESDTYSNIYSFNIAGSACGKDRPQSAIKHIMARLMMHDKMMHPPASGAGFIDSMAAAGGHGIMVIDEMADYISGAINKNSAGHQKKVLTYWIHAFTSQSSYIDGERRSDASKEKAKRVDNPLFCLLGTTNPNSLRLSLSGEEIGNGLLNRFLFFHSQISPRKRKSRDFNRNEQLPEKTFDKMREYLDGGIDRYGILAQLTKVPFTDEAMDLLDSIDNYYEDECEKLDINDRLRNLYGRAHEYVAKVALVLSDDVKITRKDVEVAQRIVSLSVATATEFCGDIADTREEADYVKVKNIIKKAGEMKLSDLVNRTQFLVGGAKRRDEILNSLAGVNCIEIVKIDTGGRPSHKIRWILNKS